MINFEDLKDLFTILKVKHNPKKHWNDSTWWGIAKSMNVLLLEYIQKLSMLQVSCLSMLMKSL